MRDITSNKQPKTALMHADKHLLQNGLLGTPLIGTISSDMTSNINECPNKY